MVAREVSENGDRKFQFVTAMKIHRLRRTFHHRRTATDLDRLPQQPLHVRRFGRGAIGLEPFFAETVFDRACHRHQFSRGFGN